MLKRFCKEHNAIWPLFLKLTIENINNLYYYLEKGILMKASIILFPITIVLCSCISNQPVRIDDSNVFEHIKVNRGDSINGNSFFKSAINKHLGKCLLDPKDCTKEQLILGEKIEAQMYTVRILGTRVWVTQPMDKLFLAAAMVAAQEGFQFFTPISDIKAYRYSETPKADANCTSVFNTVYCTTDTWTETTYWQEYDLQFIAYNNYDDIKNGVLCEDATVLSALYLTKEDMALWHYDNQEQDARSTFSWYVDAWKTKYNALDMLEGEQLAIKNFTFVDEQLSPKHVSMQEKYKQ